MNSEVPFVVPDLPEAEAIAGDLAEIVASGRYSNFGAFERRFAAGLADAVGTGMHAVTFSSATAALSAALLATVGPARPGEVVLLPSFTFAAVAQVVVLAGFTPRFLDIRDDLQADPTDQMVGAGAAPVRAAIIANPFGIGGEGLGDWEELCRDAGIPLIVDSAAGFGGRYPGGAPLGARGTCEIFSFHATKALAIGEGGALLTRDGDLAERARRISNFGFDDTGVAELPGFNGKLAEIPAALGLRQLDRLAGILERRRAVLAGYRAVLPERWFPAGVDRSALAFLPLRLDDGRDVDRIVADLAARGIEARRYYRPGLHRHPAFGPPVRALPRTDHAADHMLSLPCHAGVTPETVGRIAEVIGE
jgi:dTDP-4-amino-4,6-dideoxygalactose transaminase